MTTKYTLANPNPRKPARFRIARFSSTEFDASIRDGTAWRWLGWLGTFHTRQEAKDAIVKALTVVGDD